MKKLYGIYIPITTPFDEDGKLNLDHLRRNVRKYAASKIHGYLILGSNGENKSMTTEEKLMVVKEVIDNKRTDQVAVVGSIFESTEETISFAQKAEQLGADFIALLPPCYFKSKMTDKVLYKYFTDVASAVKIPCVLYKAPQYAGGVDLSIDLIKKCANHPNIVGIKDSSSSGVEKILHYLPDDFSVMSGSANTLVSAMMNGGVGGVISLANSLPDIVVELFDYIKLGDFNKVSRLNNLIIGANMEISGKYGVAGVKYAMQCCGFYGDYPRLPLLPLEDIEKQEIRDLLNNIDWNV